MIDLRDVTFIIPIRIESLDRQTNALLTLNYLCKHLNTNIIILEHDVTPKMPLILNSVQRGEITINYHFLENKNGNEIFHRTKFLNIMLNMVNTPVVVNYDVDILFDATTYLKCKNFIMGGQDLVYPYFWGNSQYQVYYSGRNKISSFSYDLKCLNANDVNLTRSEFGHCQFFNTKSYIEGGMENEKFISYAPEDQERGYRFKQLGYNVMWSDDYVYHLEHTRGINSSSSNPMMDQNNRLFEAIKKLSVSELREYYRSIDYIGKYKSILC
jgi:hypothetical protein